LCTSAGLSPEAEFTSTGVEQHLKRSLIHIAEYSGGTILPGLRKSEAAIHQNSVGNIQVDSGSTTERQGNLGHNDILVTCQVVASVEVTMYQPVCLHGLSECRPQCPVHRRLEDSDDGTGVNDHAPAERRRPEVKLFAADSDPGERHRGKRWLSGDPAHRREDEAGWIPPRTKGKKPRLAVHRREAVREATTTAVLCAERLR